MPISVQWQTEATSLTVNAGKPYTEDLTRKDGRRDLSGEQQGLPEGIKEIQGRERGRLPA